MPEKLIWRYNALMEIELVKHEVIFEVKLEMWYLLCREISVKPGNKIGRCSNYYILFVSKK